VECSCGIKETTTLPAKIFCIKMYQNIKNASSSKKINVVDVLLSFNSKTSFKKRVNLFINIF
jgi:hypothetical protein